MWSVLLVGGLLLALVGCSGGGTLTSGSSSDSASAQSDSGSSDRSGDSGSKDDSGDDTSKGSKGSKHSDETDGSDAGGDGQARSTTAAPTTTLGPASTSGTGGGTGGAGTGGGDPNAGAGGDYQYDPEEGTGGATGADPGEATGGGGGGATTGVGHDGLPLDLTNPFEVGRQWVLSANDGDFGDVDRFSCHADAVAVASGEQHQASLAALRQMVATGFAPRDATTGYLQVNRLDLRTGISSDVTTPMIVEDGVWKVCYYPQYL
jgi:hypothetical protein